MHQQAHRLDTAEYVRRRPEETVLHPTLSEHWPVFVERAEQEGGLPRFVHKEIEEYLRCGILRHGLMRVVCSRCGFERLVGFSCKRRGFCPSCVGRRMNDVAVHLVENVVTQCTSWTASVCC